LVTDGIPAEDFAALEALAETASLQLSVLGIGTPAGAPIPLSRGGFLKDSSGAMVVARLNEDELQGWAQSAPVRYQRSSFSDRDIELLLRPGSSERVNPGVHAAQTRQQFDNWRDAGPWLALLLLPIALLAFRRGWLLGLVGVGLLLPSPPGYALSWSDLWFSDDQQGRALLREGDAEQAAETFRDPQWQGAARYRAGDYSGAAEAFAGDDSSSGHYNRGNALARNGELEQALEAYERALELDPGNEDAASNREQVEQLLQQQQKQQQQQPQPQPQPQQSGDEPNQDQGGDPNGNQDNSQRNPGEQQGQQGDGEQQDSAGRPDSGDSNGLNDDPGEQDAEQADEQPGEQDPEQADEQPGEQDAAQGEPGNESGQAGQPEASEQAEANGEAEMGARASAEESERLQQWLRQIPDEPGDLLQRKFNYQYRQRQQAGDQNSRERY
jgi:Ca-activated chloride channel family protein